MFGQKNLHMVSFLCIFSKFHIPLSPRLQHTPVLESNHIILVWEELQSSQGGGVWIIG